MKFPKAWYEQIDVLDLNSLDKDKLDKLDHLWLEVNNRNLLPFPQITNDETRKIIDNAFSEILGIPRLDLLRTLLSQEPVISMQPLT